MIQRPSRILFAPAFALALLVPLRAKDLYVRPAFPSGAHTGADWDNAWSGFDQIRWGNGPGRVGPGDTLWLAGGNYSTALVVGASGTADNRITIKRVRATDVTPASAPGWSAALDQPVVISCAGSCIYLNNGVGSHLVIDGQTPSGIRVNYRDAGSGVEMDGGQDFADVTFRYIEAAGPGPIRQTGDTRGFNLTTAAGLDHVTLTHCEAHHSDTLIIVTRSTHLLIEHCRLHHSGAVNAAAFHPNTVYLATAVNAVFRYNTLSEIDVEGLFFGDPGNRDVVIHGNLFYQGSSPRNSGRGIEFDHRADSRNVAVYNNTFVDLPLPGVSFANGQPHPGAIVLNNIFFNNAPNFGPAAHDYNFYSGPNPGERHGIGNGRAPFLDAAHHDYHLAGTLAANQPRDRGVDLGADYAHDPDVVVRGADAAWDIGAFEYDAAKTTGAGR